ncbi:hypothetical protein [Tateyamaria sp.]|uniref:hypothetical protein n=1 Tax=Tateyamaria sp. TaxID=1929288 RepID=UPI00329ABDF0
MSKDDTTIAYHVPPEKPDGFDEGALVETDPKIEGTGRVTRYVAREELTLELTLENTCLKWGKALYATRNRQRFDNEEVDEFGFYGLTERIEADGAVNDRGRGYTKGLAFFGSQKLLDRFPVSIYRSSDFKEDGDHCHNRNDAFFTANREWFNEDWMRSYEDAISISLSLIDKEYDELLETIQKPGVRVRVTLALSKWPNFYAKNAAIPGIWDGIVKFLPHDEFRKVKSRSSDTKSFLEMSGAFRENSLNSDRTIPEIFFSFSHDFGEHLKPTPETEEGSDTVHQMSSHQWDIKINDEHIAEARAELRRCENFVLVANIAIFGFLIWIGSATYSRYEGVWLSGITYDIVFWVSAVVIGMILYAFAAVEAGKPSAAARTDLENALRRRDELRSGEG